MSCPLRTFISIGSLWAATTCLFGQVVAAPFPSHQTVIVLPQTNLVGGGWVADDARMLYIVDNTKPSC